MKEQTIEYKNGDKYVGEVKDGKPHGRGVLYSADGCKYEGEWQDGKKHGFGTLYDCLGNIEFEGEWDTDVRNLFDNEGCNEDIAIQHESEMPHMQYREGVLYETGKYKSFPIDIEKAKFHYKKAADKGHKEAIEALKRLEKEGK
jgi:hypothetical protein